MICFPRSHCKQKWYYAWGLSGSGARVRTVQVYYVEMLAGIMGF